MPAPLIKAREGFLEAYKAAIGAAFVADKVVADELTITVARDELVEACRVARDRFGYQQLMEIAAADYPQRAERFEVNYHLLSITANHRLRLKVKTDEDTPVPSVTGLWPVAGWLEREVFDMYGVTFAGNADLRRILTDYGFEGYPLRKDFPQTGYVELRYSEAEKRVVYEPVSLPQDFRNFDFLMPWEGAEYRLPGDEKAVVPEAPGAPSKAPPPEGKTADSKQADKVVAKAPAATPKTTEKPADTGAGKAANKAAATKSKAAPKAKAPAKPRARKGDA